MRERVWKPEDLSTCPVKRGSLLASLTMRGVLLCATVPAMPLPMGTNIFLSAPTLEPVAVLKKRFCLRSSTSMMELASESSRRSEARPIFKSRASKSRVELKLLAIWKSSLVLRSAAGVPGSGAIGSSVKCRIFFDLFGLRSPSDDFADGREALNDFLQAVLDDHPHSVFGGEIPQGIRGVFFQGEIAD